MYECNYFQFQNVTNLQMQSTVNSSMYEETDLHIALRLPIIPHTCSKQISMNMYNKTITLLVIGN